MHLFLIFKYILSFVEFHRVLNECGWVKFLRILITQKHQIFRHWGIHRWALRNSTPNSLLLDALKLLKRTDYFPELSFLNRLLDSTVADYYIFGKLNFHCPKQSAPTFHIDYAQPIVIRNRQFTKCEICI